MCTFLLNIRSNCQFTWRALADVFRRAWRLYAESAVLAIMILADTPEVVLYSAGYGSDLAEPTGVAPGTNAAVAVDAVLTLGTILTDVRRTVIDVVCAVLASVAASTVAPTRTK